MGRPSYLWCTGKVWKEKNVNFQESDLGRKANTP